MCFAVLSNGEIFIRCSMTCLHVLVVSLQTGALLPELGPQGRRGQVYRAFPGTGRGCGGPQRRTCTGKTASVKCIRVRRRETSVDDCVTYLAA